MISATSPPVLQGARVKQHFAILLYPFLHTLGGRDREARLQALDGYWRPWLSRLDDRYLERTLDDTAFFLPHLRSLLFPETQLLDPNPRSPAAALSEARALATSPIDELAGSRGPGAATRSTKVFCG
jgi:hypothetical protein